MKYIFYLTKTLLAILSLIIVFDMVSYYESYNRLINNIEYIKNSIRENYGIDESLKKNLLNNKIYITYDKSFGTRGETFPFLIYTKYKKVLNNKEEIIELELFVILGY